MERITLEQALRNLNENYKEMMEKAVANGDSEKKKIQILRQQAIDTNLTIANWNK